MKTVLDPAMETALNAQVKEELWSAYLYLSMSYDMKDKGYNGIGNWYAIQAKEEFQHASKFMEYISSRGGNVRLFQLGEVRQEWNSPKDAFEDTLMHEKLVTGKIYDLMDKAVELKDYPTQNLLNWFIDEQVEEEDNARKYLDALTKIEKDSAALYMFDKSLGERIQ